MKKVCIISYVDHDQDHDAMGNAYEGDPFYVGYCWSKCYIGLEAWETYVWPDEMDQANCSECIEVFALRALGELP